MFFEIFKMLPGCFQITSETTGSEFWVKNMFTPVDVLLGVPYAEHFKVLKGINELEYMLFPSFSV